MPKFMRFINIKRCIIVNESEIIILKNIRYKHYCSFQAIKHYKPLMGLVARSDARPPGIRTVAGSILGPNNKPSQARLSVV